MQRDLFLAWLSTYHSLGTDKSFAAEKFLGSRA